MASQLVLLGTNRDKLNNLAPGSACPAQKQSVGVFISHLIHPIYIA